MRISAIQCRTNTGQMAEIPVTELLQVLSANGTPLGDGIVPKSQGGRYIASGISVDATGQIKFDGYRSDRAFTGIATGIIGFTNDGRLVTLPLQQTSTASNSVSESEETMSSIENTLSFFSDNAGTLASSSILNDNGNYSVGGLSAFWKWDVNAGSINIDQSGNTLAGGADGYRINGKLVLSYNPISGELTIGNATYKTTNIQYLKSHSVAFNTDPVGIVVAPGVMSWNDTYGTVEIGLKGGNLTYRLGQSSMTYVKHADNSGLTKGTVIYPVGSDGSNKTVRLARADIEATSSKTFGVIAETVTGGGKAFCITEGLIEGINTSLLTEGSAVYLSPATAGGMTTTKPSAPNHMVLVGFCIKSHAVNGSIFVKVQNGFELDELHDVAISSLENNNLLAYESASSLWKNKTYSQLGLATTEDAWMQGGNAVTAEKVFGTIVGNFDIPILRNNVEVGRWRSGGLTVPALNISGLNASQLTATDASKNIVSLDTATYPSLTELTYLKGVTSSIQTQINGKLNTPTSLTTNFVTKWSGTAFANSQIFDNGVNVGINTNTPTDLLHINAASNGGILLTVGNAIKGIQSSTGSKVQLAWWGGADLVFGRSTEGGAITNYIWRTGNANADRMTLNATGLGIGVSSPAQALHVFTATPYQIQVQRSGVGSALIGVSSQTANSTGDLLFEGTQASQGFVFRSRDVNNVAVNSLGIDRNGNVGIGIFSPSYRLDVSGGARFTNDVIIGSGAVGVNSLLVGKTITGGVDASGIRSSGQIQSDVTNTAFLFRAVVNQANFVLPTLIVYESQIGTVSGTGTLFVNYRALANPTGFTNVFGFQGTIAAGENRWNLFLNGTANNHMAGSLGIGTTAIAGHGIRNSKTITGGGSGFSYSHYSDGVIQSDVTGAAWYFRTMASTQAASFTLPEIRHFNASQGTFGSGSSVTVQTAFFADNTIIGASFANYGFRGNIAAGTGRWNTFMDGTAQNHFRGNVGIGAGSTVPTTELDVLGVTRTTNLRITNGAAVGKVWQCNNVNGTGEWVTPLSSERYIGEWAANSGVAPSASPTTGDYYVVNTAGTYLGITYAAGDEIYWNGTAWLKRSNFLTLPIATASVLGGIKIGTGLAIDGSGVVSVASLATAKTISATGDGTWSVSFNGSADVSGALTLANVATAGTYRSVTINAKGLVTAGTNPTTLAGYGIADAYTKTESDDTFHKTADTTAATLEIPYVNVLSATRKQLVTSGIKIKLEAAFGDGTLAQNLGLEVQGRINIVYDSNNAVYLGKDAGKLDINTNSRNTIVGHFGLDASETTTTNTGLGYEVLSNLISGSGNVALGAFAGRNADRTLPLTISTDGIFIGRNSRPLADSSLNEIVIGANLRGKGNNTVAIGDSSITYNYFNGSLDYTGLLSISGVTGTSGQFLKRGTSNNVWASIGHADISDLSTFTGFDSRYQLLDGDLTAIAALAGTSGILRKTAANTWSLDTTSYFTTPTGLTTNYVSKWGGSAFANSQIFDNGTSVGIAIATPSTTSKLHVNNAVGNSVRFQNTYFSNSVESGTGFARGGIFNNAEYIEEGGVKVWKIRDIGANDAAGMLFGNSGTLNFITVPNTGIVAKSLTHDQLLSNARLTILATGLVGINTTTPAYTLDVLGTTRTTNLLITSGATSGNFLKCNNVNGTSVWSSITTSDITDLSSWAGSTSITTLGTITTGTWNGSTIATTRGGTGLTAIGTANQLLRVNAGATALEYFTPTYISGNQTITLTGIITGSGTTAITTAIADGALSIAKTSGLQTALDGKQATLSGTGLILSTAGTITYVTNNSANWNTAFGWGNHASAGYLLASTAATTYQPLDADLTSIAGLTGTTGLLRKTAANTFVLDTATYLTGITSLQVTTALGFTPYNATNPSGFITSSGSITGSAATLTTARTFTIGTTGKTFNGSANVAWTLGEIGAAPTVHTHAAVDIVSGVIAQARLGSGTASATTFLRGDQTWATLPAPTLTSTRIGFGSGSNLLTSSANFAFEDDRIISIKNGGTSKMEIARYVGLNNYGLYVHGGNLELQVISGGNIFSQSNHSFQGRILLNNLAGTAGQVLTSQGSGANPTWTTVSGGTQDLDDVLGVGNTAINKQIILNGTNSVFDSAAIMFYKNGAEKGKLHYDNQFVERLRLSSTSIIQIESSVSVGLYGTSAIIGSLSGTGTRMVVADASGVLSTQAIPSGGGVPALTSTQIAFGGGSNLMTSSSNFVYNSSIKRLEVDNIWFWRGSANDSLSLSIGTNSLSSTTSGYSNIAIGYDALKANTGGYLNAAIGLGALTDNTTGNYNTGVGTATLTDNTTGSRNTAIGYSANVASGNLTNATAIGYGALVSTSNSIMLGNFSITGLFCYETSISSPSDIRDKKNINDNSLGVNFINKLRTVTFEWNRRDGGSEGKEIGFIAQEVLSLEEEFEIAEYSKLVKTHNSEKLFLAQGRLIPILTRAIQEQQDQIDELKNIIYNINLKL